MAKQPKKTDFLDKADELATCTAADFTGPFTKVLANMFMPVQACLRVFIPSARK
jgi:hypothetical protein